MLTLPTQAWGTGALCSGHPLLTVLRSSTVKASGAPHPQPWVTPSLLTLQGTCHHTVLKGHRALWSESWAGREAGAHGQPGQHPAAAPLLPGEEEAQMPPLALGHPPSSPTDFSPCGYPGAQLPPSQAFPVGLAAGRVEGTAGWVDKGSTWEKADAPSAPGTCQGHPQACACRGEKGRTFSSLLSQLLMSIHHHHFNRHNG